MTSTSPTTTDASTSGLLEIRRTLWEYASLGVADQRLIALITRGDGFVAIEGETLDYKRELGGTAHAMAKCIATVTAMHNTFGGFLVFGVEETARDQTFSLRGVKERHVNIQQIRKLISNFTGRTIDITYRELLAPAEGAMMIGVLHIPKRPPSSPPVKFGKSAPDEGSGQPFKTDEVLFRIQDTNARALRSEDWWFLAGARGNPFLADNTLQPTLYARAQRIVDENLPDRNIICPKFVGRDDTILLLWQWLSDDLQFAKILAGDGGKGRTSIAYQFAEEVCRTRPYGFEKVIWLTAKKQQFRGLKDEFDPMEAHYSSYLELLQVLSEKMAILDDEIRDASAQLLKLQLSEALATTCTLVVIDDVDSLLVEDQRRVLETALQVGSRGSRFLLTTRKNFTYTDELCIEIRGFNQADYFQYVAELTDRLGSTVRLSQSNIERMRKATDGSPLYTESLIRLIRNNIPAADAISRWKDDLGMKVRRAALQREIGHLTVEGRRVLLAVAILFECSYTELRQVTGYDDESLLRYLDELKALFLVGAPRIIMKEPRFGVQSNTRTLVLANQNQLVADPTSIAKRCEQVRSGTAGRRNQERRKYIGGVIGQVNALLGAGDVSGAIETATAGLRKTADDPELLFVLAKCQMSLTPPDVSAAKAAYQAAYRQGQRKYQFFAAWYDCELGSRHPAGAVDVAKLALDLGSNDHGEWLIKRAVAFKAWAEVRQRAGDVTQALEDLRSCNADLKAALPLAIDNQANEILISLSIVARDARAISDRIPNRIPDLIKCFDALSDVIASPSEKPDNAIAMVGVLERALKSVVDRKGDPSDRDINLIQQRLDETINYVSAGRKRLGIKSFTTADAILNRFSANFASVREHTQTGQLVASLSAPGFEVFLAHNSADKKLVRVLAERLRMRGVKCWLDEEQIAPGQFFQDAIQRAIPESSAFAIVVGPNGVGKWQAVEMRAGISQAVQRGIPVIPVFLPDSKDIGNDLPFLSEFSHVVFSSMEDARALDRLVWGVRGKASRAPTSSGLADE